MYKFVHYFIIPPLYMEIQNREKSMSNREKYDRDREK